VRQAYARFRLPTKETIDLCPGDIIGRLWTAALRLDDPRISEAHALVSLRGDQLKLLALRGLISDGGPPISEVVLRSGVRVRLARDYAIAVEAVELPEDVLALDGFGGRPVVLTRSVYSVVDADRLQLVQGFIPDAAATIWSTGDGWRLRRAGAAPCEIEPGGRWTISGVTFSAVAVALKELAQAGTQFAKGRLYPPMRIVSRYETAHVHRRGLPTLAISGTPAQILSELVSFGRPVPWEVAAGEIWRGEKDRMVLRQRWDRNLSSLRRKLRTAGVRPDLVRSDGKGNIELLLRPGDEIVDES